MGGNRYLHYPAFNKCFFCCNDTQGCGMLIPTWMSAAHYIDTEIHDGVQTFKWEETANQHNFLYETTEPVPVNRRTVSVYQEPDDFQEFGFRNLTLPAGIFTLPSVCSVTTPAAWGLCQEIRDTFDARHPKIEEQ